jgi:hypothetical protein
MFATPQTLEGHWRAVSGVAENCFAPMIRALGLLAQALQVEDVWARIGHAEAGTLLPGGRPFSLRFSDVWGAHPAR